MTKRDFPRVHFYNQDFVDIYDKTWNWMGDSWVGWTYRGGGREKFFGQSDALLVTQEEAIFSSFFLPYSNRIFQSHTTIDRFYDKQEDSGAIRGAYVLSTGKPYFIEENPDSLGMPLFAWAEYNMYHRVGNKKRLKDIVVVIDKYTRWLDSVARRENGLYETPSGVTGMWNSPRRGGGGRRAAAYLVDFNAMMAVNALYMSAMADI